MEAGEGTNSPDWLQGFASLAASQALSWIEVRLIHYVCDYPDVVFCFIDGGVASRLLLYAIVGVGSMSIMIAVFTCLSQ